MLKILTAPNDKLNISSEPIKKIDSSIRDLVKEMAETLNAQKDPQGVGLAGIQVGINKAIFIIKPTEKGKVEVFINAKIVDRETRNVKRVTLDKTRKNEPLEGCLSIPRIWGPVKRAKKVLVEYENLQGEKKKKWFSGFKAVIIQHEIDHLQGILFTQRSLEQNAPLYEEKGEELERFIIP